MRKAMSSHGAKRVFHSGRRQHGMNRQVSMRGGIRL